MNPTQILLEPALALPAFGLAVAVLVVVARWCDRREVRAHLRRLKGWDD